MSDSLLTRLIKQEKKNTEVTESVGYDETEIIMALQYFEYTSPARVVDEDSGNIAVINFWNNILDKWKRVMGEKEFEKKKKQIVARAKSNKNRISYNRGDILRVAELEEQLKQRITA